MIFEYKNNNSKQLLLFFAGWGMDEKPFAFLDDSRLDVVVCHSYQIRNEISFDFDKYEKIFIVAWSYGVAEAERFLLRCKLKNAITVAINGTFYTINNNFGIPEKIFNLTLKTLSEQSVLRFYERMFINIEQSKRFEQNIPTRIFESVEKELQYFAEAREPMKRRFWDYAVICINDQIFPQRNQLNFWENNVGKFYLLNEGHFPFYLWRNWNELLNSILEKK